MGVVSETEMIIEEEEVQIIIITTEGRQMRIGNGWNVHEESVWHGYVPRMRLRRGVIR